MTYDISVVVLTRNRRESLKDALASVVLQTLPPDRYEILVIDNASTDGTEDLAQETGCWNANLRYIREPIASCSAARNTGWRAAQAEIVAFLDDDAIAAEDWLEKLLRGFHGKDSTLACIGGRVHLVYPVPEPDWLPVGLTGYLSGVHLSHTPVRVTEGLIAANMAVRREALEAVGGFDLRLGRRPETLLSREETCMTRLLTQRGYSCMYRPDAVVWHRIAATRLQKEWFQRRLYWEGVALAIEDQIYGGAGKVVRLTLLLKSIQQVVSPPWRALTLLRDTQTPQAFGARCQFLRDCGYVRGVLRTLPDPATFET